MKWDAIYHKLRLLQHDISELLSEDANDEDAAAAMGIDVTPCDEPGMSVLRHTLKGDRDE